MSSLRSAPALVGLMVGAAACLTGCSEGLPQSTETSLVAVTVSKPLVKNVTDYEYFTGQTAAVESVEVRRTGERLPKRDPL